MTDLLLHDLQAGQAQGCAGRGGGAAASPPTSRPHALRRAVTAHQLAAQGENELRWAGRPGSGYGLLARACILGHVAVTSPEAVEAELQRLIAEVRSLPAHTA